jgi:hypothetical protein
VLAATRGPRLLPEPSGGHRLRPAPVKRLRTDACDAESKRPEGLQRRDAPLRRTAMMRGRQPACVSTS